jgi:glycerol-1-phosphate dehydrogenase [NAD(P)+]
VNDELIRTALRDATDTDDVVIGAGALGQVPEVFRRNFGDVVAVVIADDNTWRVAGERVQAGLTEAGVPTAEPYRFPANTFVYADYTNIERLRDDLRGVDGVPVAVGSGSLNDIVKRAAHELERPYLNVSTAASMDGYTAFGAAITKAGYKQTMTCPAPKAVVADLDVLRTAPPAMTASGYGDLLGKITAGADWIVADELGIEAINGPVWDLVQKPLRASVARPAELAAGDPEAMDNLIEGLIMSGLAMQAASSSRPASGAEHQFSHLWEMEGHGHDWTPPLSHGFKVGLGSIAIAALYERILERDLSGLDVDALKAAWPSHEEVERRVRAAHTAPGLDEAAVAETLAKYLDADELGKRLELLAERWPELRKRLKDQLLAAGQLRDMLAAAGCPTAPDDIQLDRQAFKATYQRAQMIRRRYTVLDLATETGILAGCVDELFAPGGFWANSKSPN